MKEYKYKINGTEYKVQINNMDDTKAEVEVNGKAYEVELMQEPKAKPVVKTAPKPAAPASSKTTVAEAPAQSSSSAGSGVKSPLPGVILDIKVNVGDQVKAGQPVAILEAMKMENTINADREGKILEIKVKKGDSILEGSDIVIIG
ncbi:biofilm PGA synthesis protein PgaD [Porphyromonas macacae]|uniref:Biofilm PGA synthesis protein PgaD n=1 Tax=Porphyromonas macacae TaxID=28115 RepID=A0A0A2E7Z8_9PORP|nr:biotin/lipoyl-containing protein [Porphyromonas macacae]KGN75023.1 biofilm PGA synthesis protein PgaD [Porphyromonas macacae]